MRISDWSSDVCSSDLNGGDEASPPGLGQTLNSNVRVGIGRQQPLKQIALILLGRKADDIICAEPAKFGGDGGGVQHLMRSADIQNADRWQIGRASCRERECQYG